MMRMYRRMIKLVEKRESIGKKLKELIKIMEKECPIGTQKKGIFNDGGVFTDISWKNAFYMLVSKIPEKVRDEYRDDCLREWTKSSNRNKFVEVKNNGH